MKTLSYCVLAISLVGLPGCLFDGSFRESDWEPSDDGWDTDTDTNFEASAALLEGEIGGIELFGQARVNQAVSWGQGGTLDLRQAGVSGGAGMALLEVSGVTFAELEAGTYPPNETSGSAQEPSFRVTGCAGPSDGNWDWDRYTDDVTVEVEEVDPSTLRLRYTATFEEDHPDGGSPMVVGDTPSGATAPGNTVTAEVLVHR